MQIQAADYPLQVEPAQVLGFDCGLGAGLRICIFFGNKTHKMTWTWSAPRPYHQSRNSPISRGVSLVLGLEQPAHTAYSSLLRTRFPCSSVSADRGAHFQNWCNPQIKGGDFCCFFRVFGKRFSRL